LKKNCAKKIRYIQIKKNFYSKKKIKIKKKTNKKEVIEQFILDFYFFKKEKINFNSKKNYFSKINFKI
jgi:hypothetical protein